MREGKERASREYVTGGEVDEPGGGVSEVNRGVRRRRNEENGEHEHYSVESDVLPKFSRRRSRGND